MKILQEMEKTRHLKESGTARIKSAVKNEAFDFIPYVRGAIIQ